VGKSFKKKAPEQPKTDEIKITTVDVNHSPAIISRREEK
jgi:hypothetical protein